MFKEYTDYVDTERHSALTGRIVKSAMFCNFEHSSRVHGLASLRVLGLLLIYLSSALWLLGLEVGNAVLGTALFILNTSFIGIGVAVAKGVMIPCKCGQLSQLPRNLVDAPRRSIRSGKRLKLIKFWFPGLLAGPTLLIFCLMCVAYQHRELLPTAQLIIRGFALYAAIFATAMGLALLSMSYSKKCQRIMTNSLVLSEADFTVQLLDGKTHDELNELISCAVAQGNLDLAEIISQRLLLSADNL